MLIWASAFLTELFLLFDLQCDITPGPGVTGSLQAFPFFTFVIEKIVVLHLVGETRSRDDEPDGKKQKLHTGQKMKPIKL